MRIMQEGQADAVKVEGADEVFIKLRLDASGNSGCCTFGFTPQSVGVLGGYKVQGRVQKPHVELIEDSNQCQESGAIALF